MAHSSHPFAKHLIIFGNTGGSEATNDYFDRHGITLYYQLPDPRHVDTYGHVIDEDTIPDHPRRKLVTKFEPKYWGWVVEAYVPLGIMSKTEQETPGKVHRWREGNWSSSFDH